MVCSDFDNEQVCESVFPSDTFSLFMSTWNAYASCRRRSQCQFSFATSHSTVHVSYGACNHGNQYQFQVVGRSAGLHHFYPLFHILLVASTYYHAVCKISVSTEAVLHFSIFATTVFQNICSKLSTGNCSNSTRDLPLRTHSTSF